MSNSSYLVNDLENLERLVSFDAAGEPLIVRERFFRGIYQGYGSLYRNVLRTCEENDLFSHGLVKTREIMDYSYLNQNYELLLEHERIPFISYPHEWSASMMRDAALFHNELYIKLGKYNLIIKDWHPLNILFQGTDPIFVDFLSIIPSKNIESEDYLTPPHTPFPFKYLWDITSEYLFEMYRRMYVPYFLLPLYLMSQKRYNEARSRMFETTLNTSRYKIRKAETLRPLSINAMKYCVKNFQKMIALKDNDSLKTRFFQILNMEIEGLKVSPNSSAYVSYYDAKNENFSFEPSSAWTQKQKIVYDVLCQYKPDTLLDVACNAGWFSILAAKSGCQVVAIDIDESCVDVLYNYAKREMLPILPLVMNIARLTPDRFPIASKDKSIQNQLPEGIPLLLSAEKRLSCDVVLALALIHHLVLGQNLSFEKVISILNSLSKEYLVLEFVPKDDDLIREDLDFFPALKSNPKDFDWYSMENLMIELYKYFSHVEIHDSYPKSRRILVCHKIFKDKNM